MYDTMRQWRSSGALHWGRISSVRSNSGGTADFKDTRLVQSLNDWKIEVTDAGIVTSVRALHPVNECMPMAVTEAGIMTAVRSTQC